MSIMESMRSGTDSTFMQVILAAVVVSFVMWGVGPQGNQTGVVVEVNGEPVYDVDFNRQLGFAIKNYEGRTGKTASKDDIASLREDLRQSVIREVALRQEAERLGLEVSDKEVLRAVMSTPSFQVDGVFDEERYDRLLRSSGLSPSKYEAQIRESMLLTKLQELAALGVSVSKPLVEKTFVEQNTKVTLDMVRIRPAAFQASYTPTEAEIDTYLAEAQVDVQAAYDKDFDAKYEQGEQIELAMIQLDVNNDGLSSLDLEAKMKEIAAAIEAGASFEDQARKWSEARSVRDGGHMSPVEVDGLDDDLKAAVADLEVGAVTAIVATPRNVRLAKVLGRTPAKTVPLEEVQRDIAAELLKEANGPARAASFAEKELLPAWTAAEDGEAPAELLAENGLTVQTTPAIALDGSGAGLFPPPAELLEAARDAEVGTLFPTVYTDDAGVLYVAKLVSREEADLSELDDEGGEYRERTLLIARGEFVQAFADAVVARASIE